MAVLEMLRSLYGHELEAKVHCYGSSARELLLRGGTRVRQLPLEALGELPAAPTLVLHLAYLTRERAAKMPLAQYIEVNLAISRQVFEELQRLDARAVFFPS